MEELYTLEREVGRGSYGVVFEGHIAKTGKKVAIKRLPCGNPESIELYLQELWAMRATAKNHPNVIALHGCLVQTGPRTLHSLKPGKLPLDLVESALKGSVIKVVQTQESPISSCSSVSPRPKLQHRTIDTGNVRPRLYDKTNCVVASNTSTPRRPENKRRKRTARREDEEMTGRPGRCRALWLVMEFCDGGDLNQYLLSEPPDCQRNHSVILQLSSAVAFLHSLGITHRDLKPDNVLVCVTHNGPVVKVADFGLSKVSEGLVEGNLTRQHFSSTCGSDFYMAPEVWGGLSYTAQADIFSLGVMFWAVLERITILEEGATEEQLGAYVCKGRSSWLMPLGEALWEHPSLQLSIPLKCRRGPSLPPPPGPATCDLLLDMLAPDPEARPPADELEARVRAAMKRDSLWQKGIVEAQ